MKLDKAKALLKEYLADYKRLEKKSLDVDNFRDRTRELVDEGLKLIAQRAVELRKSGMTGTSLADYEKDKEMKELLDGARSLTGENESKRLAVQQDTLVLLAQLSDLQKELKNAKGFKGQVNLQKIAEIETKAELVAACEQLAAKVSAEMAPCLKFKKGAELEGTAYAIKRTLKEQDSVAAGAELEALRTQLEPRLVNDRMNRFRKLHRDIVQLFQGSLRAASPLGDAEADERKVAVASRLLKEMTDYLDDMKKALGSVSSKRLSELKRSSDKKDQMNASALQDAQRKATELAEIVDDIDALIQKHKRGL